MKSDLIVLKTLILLIYQRLQPFPKRIGKGFFHVQFEKNPFPAKVERPNRRESCSLFLLQQMTKWEGVFYK